MAAKPGEVWLADLGLAAKTRPVVILSRDDPQALARLWSMFRLPHKIAAAVTKSNWAELGS